ncbi:52 kDa repressor of the inhibitor of the protein kinase-like [Gordionus sp. m RMFG-2023]|uniref:52 kDa repressor of the inhibitor of the protein kinase-like n=1 Tax=Gordionus sp. m RMFG-2023 TaxID=3053472 RepID=UPI0031FCBEC8
MKALSDAGNLDFKNDNEKLLAVENILAPDKCYKFPLSLDKRNLTFQTSWLNKYKWLAYSAKEKGAFCKVCVIFSPRYAGPGARIIIIIDAIIWLGRQGLALRSHRVSAGPLTLSSSHNEGNFKELLKLLCNNNDKLFESSAKNATYHSPCIQNEIISICNKFILKEISTKVKASPFFSVLADERSDVGNIEQLSIAIRFIDMESETIAKEILASLQDLDLNLMRGQGYDGAPSMSGHVKGVQSRIRELYSTALYVHCSSHCLNLMISEACEIRDIRNSLHTISSVCDFFTPPKKRQLFIRTFDDIDSNNPKKKLKRFCPTRFIERQQSVRLFIELYEVIFAALESYVSSKEKDSSDAENFLQAITKPQFLISIQCLFNYTYDFSKILQKINLDLREVMNRAKDIVEILTNIRENVDEKFHDIYKKVKEIANLFRIEIFKPS